MVRDDADVFFGAHTQKGANTVDLGDMEKLDSAGNAGGRTAFDGVAHETLEAFYTVKSNIDGHQAHRKVNKYFSGLGLYMTSGGKEILHNQVGYKSDDGEFLIGWMADFDVPGIRGVSERIRVELVTPIPIDNFKGLSMEGIKIRSVSSVKEE